MAGCKLNQCWKYYKALVTIQILIRVDLLSFNKTFKTKSGVGAWKSYCASIWKWDSMFLLPIKNSVDENSILASKHQFEAQNWIVIQNQVFSGDVHFLSIARDVEINYISITVSTNLNYISRD